MKTEATKQDPWQVLELEAGTASLPDIKRAYARLLKLSRPDQDPAGFMRLRAAYEAAQALIKGETVPPPTLLGPPAADTGPASSAAAAAPAMPVVQPAREL
ncbi:MAG: hypothetical protein B7Z22_05325, partial [Hyphomonas sp. 32-62-5]